MIKIDRSFCVGSPGSAEWKTASAVTLLAQRLGKYVLAEGVETAAQVGRMMSLGVNYFQGYYFSPPVPVGQLIWRILPGAMAFSKRTLQ
jgi:EAL domain-containing protein (putative c-di-GMP-specific phosphodiesterase class I)